MGVVLFSKVLSQDKMSTYFGARQSKGPDQNRFTLRNASKKKLFYSQTLSKDKS